MTAHDGARSVPDSKHWFLLLVATTATTFTVQGMVPPSTLQQVIVTVLIGASLVLAVLAGGSPRWVVRTVVAVAVVGFVLSLVLPLAHGVDDGFVRALNATLIVVAPPAIVLGVVRDIRTSRQVRLPAVMGVLALYLLIGMFYGFLYGAIDEFGGAPFFAGGEQVTGSTTLYFSFSTLTTVGFGDLTARSDVGRTLAASEALIGQIYLVTVVAAFVGNLHRPKLR